MYKEVMAIFQQQQHLDLKKIYRSYSRQYDWQQSVLAKAKTQVFFHQFEIARLAIQISFSIRPKINQGNYLISTIISSFGVAISNVSESQLTLNRFQRRGRTLSDLGNQLSAFYMKQFMKGIYKVLGSINIVGNPYVFIKLVAEGTWEIVNQPTEGFLKGPIQGGVGIVKGGVYFTRNVVAGSFNSFEAISESLSRGIAYLTMDEKYIEKREKIKLFKTRHIFDGIKHGAFSVYTGLEVAATGLVRHPRQGYLREGTKGTITGILKGIAGLVTKPISGLFEGVSKFSQGIKNTALLFQDKPNTRRARPPRIFMSQQQYFKAYNYNESYAISFMEEISTRFSNNEILFIYITQIADRRKVAVVLTNKFLCQIDLVQKKILKQIELPLIEAEEQYMVKTLITLPLNKSIVLDNSINNLQKKIDKID